MLSRTGSGLHTMVHNPGMAYRCGSLAHYNVGLVLKGPKFNVKGPLDTPSPETGFSLAALAELSRRFDLGVVPVRRNADSQELVVPSVVDWRQGHCAAIKQRSGHLYHVADPTFGRKRFVCSTRAAAWTSM